MQFTNRKGRRIETVRGMKVSVAHFQRLIGHYQIRRLRGGGLLLVDIRHEKMTGYTLRNIAAWSLRRATYTSEPDCSIDWTFQYPERFPCEMHRLTGCDDPGWFMSLS